MVLLSRSIAFLLLLSSAPVEMGCQRKTTQTRSKEAPPVVIVDQHDGQKLIEETEPNDTPRQSALLPPGAKARGSLDGNDDLDWYRTSRMTREPRLIQVKLSASEDLDAALRVVDAQGRLLEFIDNGGGGELESLRGVVISPPVAFLGVSVSKTSHSNTTHRKSNYYELSYLWGPVEVGAEEEPNDQPTLANEIILEEGIVGQFGRRSDVDWFRLGFSSLLSDTEALRVEYDGIDGVSAEVSVFDSSGILIQRTRGMRGRSLVLSHLRPIKDRYLFLLLRTSSGLNLKDRYSLRVATHPITSASEREPNDIPELATQLKPRRSFRGLLPQGSDVDFFSVRLDKPGLIRIVLSPPHSINPVLTLFDADKIILRRLDAAGVGEPEIVTETYASPPLALIRVGVRRKETGDAKMEYRLFAQIRRDAAFEKEPNDTFETATSWPLGVQRVRGYIHPKSDRDLWFLPRPIQGERFRLIAPDNAKASLALYCSGQIVSRSNPSSAATRPQISISKEHSEDVVVLEVKAHRRGNAHQTYTIEREFGSRYSGVFGCDAPLASSSGSEAPCPHPIGGNGEQGLAGAEERSSLSSSVVAGLPVTSPRTVPRRWVQISIGIGEARRWANLGAVTAGPR